MTARSSPQEQVKPLRDTRALARAFDPWAVLVIGAVVLGAVLRFWDLSGPSLSHVEIYIPGIDLIPGISEPTPRHGFLETLSWQFHREPHPPGYYMAMWVWTALAGTSEFALRLPNVLIGSGSVWLIWKLGQAIFDRRTAALAALLLAVDGFHVYWSQIARMYVPGAALAIVATWALVSWMRAGERRPWLEAGYAAALIAGTQCDELFWAIPFLHLAWVVIAMPAGALKWRDLWRPSAIPTARIVQIQVIAMALASPEFIHSAQLAYNTAAPPPTPRFLVEYAGFGFLFQSDDTAWPETHLPTMVSLLVAALGLLLAVRGARAQSAALARSWPKPLAAGALFVAATVGIVVAVLLETIAGGRRSAVLPVFVFLPLLCLWLPGLAIAGRSLAAPLFRWAGKSTGDGAQWLPWRISPFGLLLLMLTFVPPLVFYVSSFKMSVLAARAFLPFAPFYVLLVAAGVSALSRGFAVWGAVAATVVLFAASTVYFHGRPHSRRDYKTIATLIAREEQPNDVILVRPRNWADTPMYYYLRNANYVADAPATYFQSHHPARVWVAKWLAPENLILTNDRPVFLLSHGYAMTRSWRVKGGDAELFEPTAPSPPVR